MIRGEIHRMYQPAGILPAPIDTQSFVTQPGAD